MKKSTKAFLGITAAAGATTAFFATGEALFRLILTQKAVNGSSKLLEEDKEFEEIFNTNEYMLEGAEWFANVARGEWTITARRGETLHADVIFAEQPSNVWVVCAHGYAVMPESNSAQAKMFHSWGYNVLMPSLCGHGRSECNYVAMGWEDRLDLCEWIHHICSEYPDSKIVLYGISMGGAAVMMTTGEDLPDNVVCAIEDCGYTSVYDEFKTQIREALHLPAFPLLNAADAATRIHAGYSFKQADSISQLRKSKTPTLFIHGAEDDFVPVRMLDTCFNAAACEKEKLIIAGARHGCSGLTDPDLYFKTIKNFTDKYLK